MRTLASTGQDIFVFHMLTIHGRSQHTRSRSRSLNLRPLLLVLLAVFFITRFSCHLNQYQRQRGKPTGRPTSNAAQTGLPVLICDNDIVEILHLDNGLGVRNRVSPQRNLNLTVEAVRGSREFRMRRSIRDGANGRFENDIDVAVYECFLRCNDSRALQVEVVVETVEDEVHAVRGNAVDELHDLVGGLKALLQSNWEKT